MKLVVCHVVTLPFVEVVCDQTGVRLTGSLDLGKDLLASVYVFMFCPFGLSIRKAVG